MALIGFDSNGASSPTSPEQGSDLVLFADLVKAVWRRKGMFALTVAAGLACGIVYCALARPGYESTAQVLVLRKRPPGDAAPSPRSLYPGDEMPTHVAVMTSPRFVEQALEPHGLGSFRSLEGSADPVQTAIRSLAVSVHQDEAQRTPGSILHLSFQGSVAEDCPRVLEALIDRYREFLGEISRNVDLEAWKLVAEKAEAAQQSIRQNEVDYRAFLKARPLLWNGELGTSAYLKHLADLETQHVSMRVRQSQLQTRLAEMKSVLQEGNNGAAVLGMMPVSLQQTWTTAMEEKLLPLLLQEKRLLLDFGKDHPDVQAVRHEIALTRKFFEPLAGGTAQRATAVRDQTARAVDPVLAQLQALEVELSEVTRSEQELARQVEKQRREARDLAYYEFESQRRLSEITRAEEYFESLIQDLRGLDLSKDLGGYSMHVISPPQPALQTSPKALLALILAGLAGTAAGLGLVYRLDQSDRAFRSPDEILYRLGLPVIGQMPWVTASRAQGRAGLADLRLHASLCAFHRPESDEAEAYRGVRAALSHRLHGDWHRVIQVTSLEAGDGKTTLAANLAVSMAQAGRSVVLVDANLRAPQIGRLLGIGGEIGLTTVIRGESDLDGAVQHTAIPGLSVLPCGPRPAVPADLLSSPCLGELLEQLRERFELVLVDSPDLLSASDALVIAPKVDGVLLAVRVDKSPRPHVERTCELLNSLPAAILGAVVNGRSAGVRFRQSFKALPGRCYVAASGDPARNGSSNGSSNGLH
jgi:capsular exopolysaccharide synthesis family protein